MAASKWWRTPQLDESKVGLALVDVLFALVLAGAFTLTLNGISDIALAGWSHLTLAASAIILSWIGYHAGRAAEYLWLPKFFNKPFFQYFVDILILSSYWVLIITAEGVPRSPDSSKPPFFTTSARPESVTIATIFLLYWLWDTLQVKIMEDPIYIRAMIEGPRKEGQPPRSSLPLVDPFNPSILKAGPYPTLQVTLRFPFEIGYRIPWTGHPFYAFPARLMRQVTTSFLAASVVALYFIFRYDPQTTPAVITVDAAYLVGLLLYRYLQAESQRLFDSQARTLDMATLERETPRGSVCGLCNQQRSGRR